MSVKIFDVISLEEIHAERAIVDNIDYHPTMLNLQPQIRGIQFATEQISHLAKLKAVLLKHRNKPFNENSKKLSILAIESITSKLKLGDVKSLSMESLNGENALNLSIESITETIKEVWAAIVRTFKYIWEKIKSFFSGSKQRTAMAVSKTKRNETELKQITQEIEKLEVPIPEGVMIKVDALLNPLKYLNKNISQNELIELPNSLDQISKIINDIILEVEKLYISINMSSENINENDQDSFRKFCASTTEEGNFSLFETFNIFAQNMSNIVDDEKPYKEYLNNSQQNNDIVRSDSVKLITGFINGGAIAGYTLSNKDTGKYVLKCIDECNNEHGNVSIAMPDIQGAEMFAGKVTTLTRSLEDLGELFNSKNISLEIITKQIFINIGKIINNISKEDKDSTDNGLDAFKNVSNYISNLNAVYASIYHLFERSVLYYSALLDYIKNHYKQVNEAGKA